MYLYFFRESSGVNASFFGYEAPHLHAFAEHDHLKLSHGPENELDFGLSLISNDGGNDIPRETNSHGVCDVERSGGTNAEDLEIRMDLSDDLLHLVCLYVSLIVLRIHILLPLHSTLTKFFECAITDILLLMPEGFM